MSSSRKVKGAIFSFKHSGGALGYFLSFQMGETTFKVFANVYTCDEIRDHMAEHPNWAPKKDGKWLLVYE